MGSCDCCGKEERYLYRCRYCGGHFCAAHHLPLCHSCIHAGRWVSRQQRGDPGMAGEGSRPDRRCVLCGFASPHILFCPFCGNPYCELHRAPENHGCGGVDSPLHASGPSAGSRTGIHPLLAAGILGMAILVIASALVGPALLQIAGRGEQVSAIRETPPIPQPSPFPPRNATVAPTTGTDAALVLLKVPPTQVITPMPTMIRGILSYPAIVADPALGSIVKNYTFPFQDRTVTISAGVNVSVYNGARNGEKAVVMNRDDIARRDWAPGYFRAFIGDERQGPFFDGLVSAFRTIRRELALSDDEYLDLMTVFVQSIPYDAAGAQILEKNRFPVETFVDGKGVCGDKSLLLAGLLSREGYDIALLVFEAEEHMALGIRADGGYRNTGYAYIETTRPSFVGIVPEELAGNITLTSTPYVIPVGNGWKGYPALNETLFIRDQSDAALARVAGLKKELFATRSFPEAYNKLVVEHNRQATLLNYIATHRYDRPGTYAYVRANATASPSAARPVPQHIPAKPSYATCGSEGERNCPAGALCCGADTTCYAPCLQGVWVPETCVCRV